MKRVLLIGVCAMVAVSLTLAVPSYSRAHGGWGAGWFVGGLALGTALGFASRPYYYYPPPARTIRRLHMPTRRTTSMSLLRPQPAPRSSLTRSLRKGGEPAKVNG